VKATGRKVNVTPPEIAQLTDPQPANVRVAISGRRPMPLPVGACLRLKLSSGRQERRDLLGVV
jgi:hypothetical protein